MLYGIQRLWKRWAVLYQEPAALDDTSFPSNDMVTRLRCFVVIIFSWKNGAVYRCWLYATVACVREGFLRLPIGWSSQCCLGGRSYWGGIFLVHLHQFAVCSWANCAGGVPWLSFSENVLSPEGACAAAVLCPPAHQASSQLRGHGSTRSLPSLTGGSILVDTVICKALGWDESQITCLKNVRLFSPRRFVHAMYVLPCKSVSYYMFCFFSFWMGKRQGELESVEWTWGSLVSIPEDSPAPQTADLQWLGGIIKRSNWNQSSTYLANTCSAFGILKTSQCQLMK